MGRDPRVREPPGVDHLYPDPDRPLDVVIIAAKNVTPNPTLRLHWAICWQVGVASTGDAVHRQLAVVRERGPGGLLPHLTNWGPKTRIDQPLDDEATVIPIATLSRGERRRMEAIAASEPVKAPNGVWNCKTWVSDVLRRSVEEGIISAGQRLDALRAGGWTSG